MTNVRETITTTMRNSNLSGYVGHAEPVIAAVEARETGIVESLVAYGRGKGLSEVEVRGALENAGLPGAPVIAQAPVTTGAHAAAGGTPMERIEGLLGTLVEAVRSIR